MDTKVIIAAVIVGLLIVGAVTASVVTNNQTVDDNAKTTTTGCSSCGNSCSAEKNCGLATCGAVNGGTCGCNKK
ncbi:MAG: hypothetical protein WC438_04365 [Candidatus Pacearchaeota archaeon]